MRNELLLLDLDGAAIAVDEDLRREDAVEDGA